MYMTFYKEIRSSTYFELIHTHTHKLFFTIPVIRVNVVLQCCFCITGQSREKLPHYVLVLNLLVSLELTETRVEVIQEDQQRGGISKVSAQELTEGEGGKEVDREREKSHNIEV